MRWFQNFMAGRRGADQLSFGLMVAGVLLTLVSSILSWFAMHTAAYVAYIVLQTVSAALFVYAFYRMFSRNIQRRDTENRKFLAFGTRFTGHFRRLKMRFRDRKTHRYLRCSHCRAELRVPKGKGTIVVTCPKCHAETKIKT